VGFCNGVIAVTLDERTAPGDVPMKPTNIESVKPAALHQKTGLQKLD